MVMTVNPGFGGQAFLPETMDKVRELAALREEKGLDFDIEVDGGIDGQTISQAKEAGANVFVAGSYVFNGDVNESRSNAPRCSKWVTSQYWREVTARSCPRGSWTFMLGVDGGCLKLLEQGLPLDIAVGISILSLRPICARSEPKPSRLFNPSLKRTIRIWNWL